MVRHVDDNPVEIKDIQPVEKGGFDQPGGLVVQQGLSASGGHELGQDHGR